MPIPSTEFNGKIVWITGASSGIGEALAQNLAALGAKLILTARNTDQLTKIQASLSNPDQHMIATADLTDAAQVEKAYADVIQTKGRIDYLINNAGLSQRALIAETTMETERRIMEIDYFSQVFLTKLVVPKLIEQGSGKVVFISSIAGLLGTQYRASYSAAKGAVHLWANSLRAEVHEKGVKVAVVFPGFVQTNVSFNALTGDGTAQNHQDDAIEQGLSVDYFANEMIKALSNNKEYIVIGGFKEKLGTIIGRICPSLLYKVIRRTQVK